MSTTDEEDLTKASTAGNDSSLAARKPARTPAETSMTKTKCISGLLGIGSQLFFLSKRVESEGGKKEATLGEEEANR